MASKSKKSPKVIFVVFDKRQLKKLVFKDGSRVKWESDSHGRMISRNNKGQFQSEGFRVAAAC